jgi:beta-lactam-binding protein with PASTA domain
VVDQDPRRGGLSAHDEVTVVVTKARFGLLPNFVGSSLADAQREARRLKVTLVAKTSPGREGTVLRQVPKPGVAIAPGLRVRLVVGDGSRS